MSVQSQVSTNSKERKQFTLELSEEGTLEKYERVPPKRKPVPSVWTYLEVGSSIASSILVPLLVSIAIGRYSDNRFVQAPTGTHYGLAVGLFLSFASFIVTLRSIYIKLSR